MLSGGYNDERAKLAADILKREAAIQQRKGTVSNADGFIARGERCTDIIEFAGTAAAVYLEDHGV